MTGPITISDATPTDAAEIAGVYAWHVLHGTASWETAPPDAAEMTARMTKVLDAGWPWLVARDGAGAILGYAYAAQFNPRAGYRHTLEDSIYLRHDARGQGVGKALLAELIARCEAAGARQMIAGIAGGEPASIALHAKFGFIEVARIPSVGRKHGQWLDLIYMQRALGEGATTAPEVEP